MSDVLHGMRGVKMAAWEAPLSAKVATLRAHEADRLNVSMQIRVRVTRHASRVGQFHLDGGQLDFAWLPARTDAPPWGVRVVSQTKSSKMPTRNISPLFFV